jgi:hypothetical protein
LDREEATSLLKEITASCQPLANQIALMPPDADDVYSHGYQLHIKTMTLEQDERCMRPIVQKHGLAMAYEKERELIVIYRPTKK